MSALYQEIRPAFTGDATYTATLTLPGTGSIAGYTFTAVLTDAGGTVIAGGATAVVLSGSGRTVTLTVVGRSTAGDYHYAVRRTDSGLSDVVASGVVEVTDPVS